MRERSSVERVVV